VAVLDSPLHYREDDAIAHIGQLKLREDQSDGAGQSGIVPLMDFDEEADFSYACIYHPWLVGREGSRLVDYRRTPPSGAASAVLAVRANERGAWIAPANELLAGVVALDPPVSRERRQDLQNAQLNLVRQEPRGFLWLNADTLSDDIDLRPLNVRRLLILLRRLALREGAHYVFEPNDDAFRRVVQAHFEGLLGQMYDRGAFAGGSARASFQVVVDSSLNTPRSVEQGRLIVELRVAPSIPMRFLTIRLLQRGERAVAVETR
jgi:phage tail sheath protein FI